MHIADKSDTNFRKILDLKGIRKQDQSQLVELFVAHRSGPRHESLPQYSAFLTPIQVSSGNATTGIAHATNLGSANLHALQGRFDPSTFGSALMTAARDGVDRLGTPMGGNSGTGSRAQSPPPGSAMTSMADVSIAAGANVNQNLRNIGKFFKRDIGGFGGRFGGHKGGEENGR